MYFAFRRGKKSLPRNQSTKTQPQNQTEQLKSTMSVIARRTYLEEIKSYFFPTSPENTFFPPKAHVLKGRQSVRGCAQREIRSNFPKKGKSVCPGFPLRPESPIPTSLCRHPDPIPKLRLSPTLRRLNPEVSSTSGLGSPFPGVYTLP